MKNEQTTPLDNTLQRAMEKAMEDPELRVLLWHIVSVFLYTFTPEYSHNATAYSLLAKKEAGLHLLAWMKQVSPEGTFHAESEYNNLINQLNIGGDNNGRGTDSD